MEADSEAINFIRSRKQRQKILKARKQKQTRKRDTSRGAGSRSNKKLVLPHPWSKHCVQL